MKGSVSILRVSIAILFSLVIVTKGADFTGITCDFSISGLTDFLSFASDANGLSGTWSGNKNVCFQEGQYNFSSLTAQFTFHSSQTWYGPQYLADPTCSGSFSPNCARAVSAKALDSTQEAVIYYTPQSIVITNIFVSESIPFSMIGFSLYNSNSEYFLFNLYGPTTLTNNYFFTPPGNDPSEGPYTFGFQGSVSLTYNWFDGSGTIFATSVFITSGGLVSNNYFTSNLGMYLEATSSDTITITGNIFVGGPNSYNIYDNGGNTVVRNNTFITPYSGIYINSAGYRTIVIDSNLFVFSYSDPNYYETSLIFISGSGQCNITSNVFAGPGVNGIYGSNPYYLAYNDFSESEIILIDTTWDVSAAHVYNNYFGPYGPFNVINSEAFVDNTRIPNVFVDTASSSIVPYTTTPNHPSLIPPPLITNVEWTLLGADRPYFLVGDQTNFTWTFSIPSWYDVYNIPISYFTALDGATIDLYGSAVGTAVEIGTSDNNLGGNSYIYTPSSGDLQALGGQYGYFMTLTAWDTPYSIYPAKSLFSQEPVSFTFNTLPINGYFYSDQGAITANIYTDLNIKNIIFSFKSTITKYHHHFLFLSNGTGSTQSYTIPVSNVTRESIWKLSANFTLVTGETYEIKDTHTFGYVISADCNITVYLNKKFNTTVHPNIKKYCPSTPYNKIAWYDSELSDNKGTVSVNNNNTYFIVTPYQNRSGIATWNYGILLSNGQVSNFTATLIITSANPSHNSWSNVTWNLETNQSINVTQNIAGLVSYSSFPVQITGLYPSSNSADANNTQQVDAMSLYLKKQKAVLVGKSDGTLSLYTAVVTNGQASAGAPITSGFSSHWTFQVSLWAGDEDLNKTSDTASITLYVN